MSLTDTAGSGEVDGAFWWFVTKNWNFELPRPYTGKDQTKYDEAVVRWGSVSMADAYEYEWKVYETHAYYNSYHLPNPHDPTFDPTTFSDGSYNGVRECLLDRTVDNRGMAGDDWYNWLVEHYPDSTNNKPEWPAVYPSNWYGL